MSNVNVAVQRTTLPTSTGTHDITVSGFGTPRLRSSSIIVILGLLELLVNKMDMSAMVLLMDQMNTQRIVTGRKAALLTVAKEPSRVFVPSLRNQRLTRLSSMAG